MSTRGLYGFRYKGVDYLVFNKSDSYPSGLGINTLWATREYFYEANPPLISWGNISLTELRNVAEKRIDALQRRVQALTLVQEDRRVTLEELETLQLSGFFQGLPDRYPTWREVFKAAEGCISLLIRGTLGFIAPHNEFMLDSLFCEWAYIIDLDAQCFEVWEGAQKEPTPRGLYGETPNDEGYYPCKLIKSYPIYRFLESGVLELGLPTEQEFLDELKALDDE